MAETQIALRRDIAANWTSVNPILAEGEIGIELDAIPVNFKIGDGVTAWNDLDYTISSAPVTSVNGQTGVVNLDDEYPKIYSIASAPTESDDIDDGYKRGDFWIDTSGGYIYQAFSVVSEAASWFRGIFDLAIEYLNATAETNIISADLIAFLNSTSNGFRTITFANFRAALKTYYDTLYQPVDSDLTAVAGLTPSNDDVIQRKAGSWTNRTIAQLVTDIRTIIDSVYSAIGHTHTAVLPNPLALSTSVSPTALSADVVNYNPTGLHTNDVLRLSTNDSTARTITGLHAGVDGEIKVLLNVGDGTLGGIILAAENVSSTFSNRFRLPGNIYLEPNGGSVTLRYDGTGTRWRAIENSIRSTTTTPLAIGTASAGSEINKFSREDHVHAGSHLNLSNIGVNSHAVIDTMIATTSIIRPDTWTRVSNTSFTVPGDLTIYYRKNTKMLFNDGGYKWGVVYTSSFSSGVTTVTMIPTSDFVLSGSSVTEMYLSYSDNQNGFPDWFNYTPSSITGWSSNPASAHYKWRTFGGDNITVHINQPSNGTSNATTISIALPVTAKTLTGAIWVATPGQCVDNSIVPTTPCYGQISSAGTAVDFYKDYAGTAWTGTGNKRVVTSEISYRH